MGKLLVFMMVALISMGSSCIHKGTSVEDYELSGMWAIYRAFSCTDPAAVYAVRSVVGSVFIYKSGGSDIWLLKFGKYEVPAEETRRDRKTIYLGGFSFPIVGPESGTIEVHSLSLTVKKKESVSKSLLLSARTSFTRVIKATTGVEKLEASCSWEYEFAG